MSNKIMIRIAAVALVSALVLTLLACGGMQPAKADAAQLANPMQEVTFDKMVEKAGVPLHAPEGAENVRYFTITTDDHVIAQMDFSLNGKEYTYRGVMGEMKPLELSGMYLTDYTESFAKVSYADGQFITKDNTSVLFWEDMVPGACYSITCTDCENPIVLQEIAERTFVPMQGDCAADDVTVEYPDVEGHFTDENYDTVDITHAEGQKYDVTVGIYRLTSMDGTGELNTKNMTMTLQDANGNPMYAEFTPCEDGSFTLKITASTWPLLETGTEFPGFFRPAK